jgi:hypothetical protein
MATITCYDALNCQKDIAETIVDQGVDHVLALKGNPHDLFEGVKLCLEMSLSEGFGEKHQAMISWLLLSVASIDSRIVVPNCRNTIARSAKGR